MAIKELQDVNGQFNREDQNGDKQDRLYSTVTCFKE